MCLLFSSTVSYWHRTAVSSCRHVSWVSSVHWDIGLVSTPGVTILTTANKLVTNIAERSRLSASNPSKSKDSKPKQWQSLWPGQRTMWPGQWTMCPLWAEPFLTWLSGAWRCLAGQVMVWHYLPALVPCPRSLSGHQHIQGRTGVYWGWGGSHQTSCCYFGRSGGHWAIERFTKPLIFKNCVFRKSSLKGRSVLAEGCSPPQKLEISSNFLVQFPMLKVIYTH